MNNKRSKQAVWPAAFYRKTDPFFKLQNQQLYNTWSTKSSFVGQIFKTEHCEAHLKNAIILI